MPTLRATRGTKARQPERLQALDCKCCFTTSMSPLTLRIGVHRSGRVATLECGQPRLLHGVLAIYARTEPQFERELRGERRVGKVGGEGSHPPRADTAQAWKRAIRTRARGSFDQLNRGRSRRSSAMGSCMVWQCCIARTYRRECAPPESAAEVPYGFSAQPADSRVVTRRWQCLHSLLLRTCPLGSLLR